MTVTTDRMKQKLAAFEAEEHASTSPTNAFETAFRENWNRICAVLYRMVGDTDEAEDLALETFWRLYQRSDRPGQEDNLSGWLYRVAVNLGYNALRSRKRRQSYEEKAGILDYERAAAPNPATESEQAEERKRVRQALSQLKPRSAQMLVLRYSGLSYAEIASALEIAPGSVGTLLVRAEQEFEKCYKKLEGR